jgi:hypothetical protein
VSADYEKIRDENIARYGWDTAVLDLLGQLYSERTHFIFELIQNAEDARATGLAFELFPDRLEVRHDGRPFTDADVRGICGVGKSPKSGDLTKIGKFGIGFKSVYAYTKTPRVYSQSEHFRIEKYVRPYSVEPPHDPAPGTLFIFPFDHDEISAATAVQEIADALGNIELGTLLFLQSIERVRIRGVRTASAILDRVAATGTRSSRHVILANSRDSGHRNEEWLVWHRRLGAVSQPAHRVEIAFRLSTESDGLRLLKSASSPLAVFFPTAKETFLGFLIQGPYRTTPARDNIPEHDIWNQDLVRETAALLAEVLRELRDEELLTVDVLQAMPLDAMRFQPRTMFHPIFSSARAALLHQELIPVAGGGYGSAQALKLARGAGLRDLLLPGQLGELYGTETPLAFAHDSITENRTPDLWRYLREEIGVDEVTPEVVVARVTREFLAAQSDDWTARFYAFLFQNAALWREPRFRGQQPGAARAKPIIRLEDGSQVEPFDARGLPAAYLPGSAETEFPTVRQVIADVPDARQFLEALKFTEPDVVAEVLDKVVPRYKHLDAASLDPAQHEADLGRIARALAEAGSDRRLKLREQLIGTAFVVGENAETGETRLMRPCALYQRTEDLEMYFDGNPGAWFLQETYKPWLDYLRDLGVRDAVAVSTRHPNRLGYVTIVDVFGQHERGLDGFDSAAEIDGLDFALGQPSGARSEFVWNVLLAPNRQLIAGTVERSGRMEFIDASREDIKSAIGRTAATSEWLPGPDGEFCRPAELLVDDLPPGFKRDEVLAKALDMVQPVVEEASRQLGISPAVLRGLSERPDLVAMIEQELRSRFSGKDQQSEHDSHADDTEPASGPEIDYSAALSDIFDKPGRTERNEDLTEIPATSGVVNNPELRRARIQASISEDKDAEPPSRQRFWRVSSRVWEAKDSAVRQFLLEQYDGHCQICRETFTKRDTTPYFEGLYLVGHTHGRWLDRPGNVVCLCPTCCAKFQHGTVEATDILDQIKLWRTRQEGGGDACLTLRLCGQPTELQFTEKHLLDLQEIIKTDF